MRARICLAVVALVLVAAVERPEGQLQVGDVVVVTRDVRLEFPARDLRLLPLVESDEVVLRAAQVSFDGAAAHEVGERWARLHAEFQLFSVGEVQLPALVYEVLDPNGVPLRRGESASEAVTVERFLPEEDEPVPAGLAPPFELELRPARLAILAAIGGVGLLALLVFAVWGVRRWRARRAARPGPPPPPPHEIALGRLQRLLAGGALRDGDIRRFHIDLASILKRYLEDRYGFPAVERTTGELGRDLRPLAMDVDTQRLALHVLAVCDEVKFAGDRPDLEAMRQRAAQARTVVTRTAPAGAEVVAT